MDVEVLSYWMLNLIITTKSQFYKCQEEKFSSKDNFLDEPGFEAA